jgi:hypothetical protein
MNYTISSFRNNMWEILDKTKFEKKITTIWRRHKKEFVILPVEILQNIDYKTILSELEKKYEENDYTTESLIVANDYIKKTNFDDINWSNYIIK